jgi:hypothetical protein
MKWVRLARWRDWVQSKLPFLTAITVLLLPSATSASRVLEIVATIVAGAAFGYGLNEVSDRASDRRAGKLNRAAELPRWQWLAYLILTGAGAVGLSFVWAPDAAAPVLVLLSLGLASAYSVPPLRLKERGVAGLATAAAAQWALPVLVVSAAEPDGWLHASSWLFALLSMAIGTRWMVVHQLLDALRDRRSGVRTYLSRRLDVGGLLPVVLACELVLLGAGLASSWPRSAPAAIALGPYLAFELYLLLRRRSLSVRLASYEQAPLAAYYFFVLPVALAIGELVTATGSGTVAGLLLAVALPQLVAMVRGWRGGAGSAVNRARASVQRPVVSASEPQP